MGQIVVVGTIAILLFIALILWQIILLMSQRTKHMEFKRDYTDFKITIESSLKKEVDEIIKQNRALIVTINKLIEHKTNDRT